MKDIIALLDKEMKIKLESNPNYSLRSYASYLGISASSLSRILSGQIDITPKVFKVIGEKLNLTPDQYAEKLNLLQVKKAQSNIRNIKDGELNVIDMEMFNLISDWYHYAILHMCSMPDFVSDPKWIARRLGIDDESLIEQAVARLLENKLLDIDEEGRYYKTDEIIAIKDYSFSSVAMRERQKQILELSAEKIDSVPMELRDHSTVTIPVDENLLPEIKDRIKKFRRTLGNYIIKNNLNSEQIYELQISFFPLLVKN